MPSFGNNLSFVMSGLQMFSVSEGLTDIDQPSSAEHQIGKPAGLMRPLNWNRGFFVFWEVRR
jgi:hypothetical protein